MVLAHPKERDRVKRHRLFGIQRRRLWDFDAAARSGYRELVERDRRWMIGEVDHAPERVVLIVARGDRADELVAYMNKHGKRDERGAA